MLYSFLFIFGLFGSVFECSVLAVRVFFWHFPSLVVRLRSCRAVSLFLLAHRFFSWLSSQLVFPLLLSFYPLLSPFSIFILKRSRFHQLQEPICYDDPPVPRWLLTFHFYGWLLPLPLLCLQLSFGRVVVVRIFAGVCIFEGVWRQQSLSQTS